MNKKEINSVVMTLFIKLQEGGVLFDLSDHAAVCFRVRVSF